MNAIRGFIFPRITILKPRKIPPLRYLLYSLIAIALGAVFSQLATPAPGHGDKPLSLDLGSPLPTERAEQARETHIQESRRSLDSAQDQGDLFERFSRALEKAPDSLCWASLFGQAIAHPLLEGHHAKPSDTGTQSTGDFLKELMGRLYKRPRSTAPEFARLWTQAAHLSQSLYQRALYSRFFDLAWIGEPEELDLAPRRHEWLPGDTIAYSCPLAYERDPAKPALRLEVARITLDSSFWPESADILDTMELNPVQQSASAHPVLQGPALAKPGLYRLTLLHPSFFQEDYVRVSRLRLALGQSPNSLDAWGSSLHNQVPPPYTLHIQRADGSWLRQGTDSLGLLRFHIKGWPSPSTRVVLTAKGEAPVLATLPALPPSGPRPYLWSDRPLYRQGDTLRLHGYSLGSDSALLSLYDNQNRRLWQRRLAVDAFGQFASAVPLEIASDSGRWFYVRLQLDSVYRQGRWIGDSPPMAIFPSVRPRQGPTHSIRFTSLPSSVRRQDSVTVGLQARQADGSPLSKSRLVVRWLYSDLYFQEGLQAARQWRILRREDTLRLDAQGKGRLTVLLPWTEPKDQEVLLEAYTLDSANPSLARAVMRVADSDAFLGLGIDEERNGKRRLHGYALDLHARPLHTPLTLQWLAATRLLRTDTLQAKSDGSFSLYPKAPPARTDSLRLYLPSLGWSRTVEWQAQEASHTEPGLTVLEEASDPILSLRGLPRDNPCLLQFSRSPGQVPLLKAFRSMPSLYLDIGQAESIHLLYGDSTGLDGLHRRIREGGSRRLRATLVNVPARIGHPISLRLRITHQNGTPARVAFSASLYDQQIDLDLPAHFYEGDGQPSASIWERESAPSPLYPSRFQPHELFPWPDYENQARYYETNSASWPLQAPIALPEIRRPRPPRDNRHFELSGLRRAYEDASEGDGWLASEPFSHEMRLASEDLGSQAYRKRLYTTSLGFAQLELPPVREPGTYTLHLVGSDTWGRLLDQRFSLQVLP